MLLRAKIKCDSVGKLIEKNFKKSLKHKTTRVLFDKTNRFCVIPTARQVSLLTQYRQTAALEIALYHS